MLYFAVKLAITAVLVVVIGEIAKRSSFLAAFLASIPLVSVLAMIWLYVDTRDVNKVATLSTGVFWLVLPSLVLFILLPILLRKDFGFVLSLSLSILATAGAYFIMIAILQKFGVKL